PSRRTPTDNPGTWRFAAAFVKYSSTSSACAGAGSRRQPDIATATDVCSIVLIGWCLSYGLLLRPQSIPPLLVLTPGGRPDTEHGIQAGGRLDRRKDAMGLFDIRLAILPAASPQVEIEPSGDQRHMMHTDVFTEFRSRIRSSGLTDVVLTP